MHCHTAFHKPTTHDNFKDKTTVKVQPEKKTEHTAMKTCALASEKRNVESPLMSDVSPLMALCGRWTILQAYGLCTVDARWLTDFLASLVICQSSPQIHSHGFYPQDRAISGINRLEIPHRL